VDLDGVPDVLVGDPFFGGVALGLGRVQLFSGATRGELWSFIGPAPRTDLGGVLAFLGDVDLDGRPDVAAGQAGVAVGSQSGGPFVLSGADGSLVGHVKDHAGAASSLGEALAGIGDLDGDGRGELLAAAPGAQGERGEVRVYSFACEPVATYCSGKASAQGCQPRMDWGGVPGASAGAPFELRGLSLPAGTTATLFYSLAGPAAVPFQGGTLCVQPPARRTPAQPTGGAPGTCGGAIAFDFNAWTAAGADPGLVPGAQVWGQVWGRDPGDPFGSTLTDALVFRVCP
jgi:hypothetical protein